MLDVQKTKFRLKVENKLINEKTTDVELQQTPKNIIIII